VKKQLHLEGAGRRMPTAGALYLDIQFCLLLINSS
jgi:hypothetical protein